MRRLKNVGMIAMDYLQLMQSDTHKDNRVLAVADITRDELLLRIKIPVLLCSQLQDLPGARKTSVLTFARFGCDKQDADIVMMLLEKITTPREIQSAPSEQLDDDVSGKNRHGQPPR